MKIQRPTDYISVRRLSRREQQRRLRDDTWLHALADPRLTWFLLGMIGAFLAAAVALSL